MFVLVENRLSQQNAANIKVFSGTCYYSTVPRVKQTCGLFFEHTTFANVATQMGIAIRKATVHTVLSTRLEPLSSFRSVSYMRDRCCCSGEKMYIKFVSVFCINMVLLDQGVALKI